MAHFSRAVAIASFVVLTSWMAGCDEAREAKLAATSAAITYHKDVQPVFERSCVSCHQPGTIAPFTLSSYADLTVHKQAIRDAVATRRMPPWMPGSGCADYAEDRSLADADIETIIEWIDQGVAEGAPGDYVPPAAAVAASLSRVDLTVKMPQAYTPVLSPDEYRCFVLDWSQAATKYVTGFRATPGNAAIVHHVIAYLITPARVAAIQKLDSADAGPGYGCFGGAGGGSSAWIGAWAPGSGGSDFPSGTGIKVDPGSKIVLQVHYNTPGAAPAPDLTTLDFKLDGAVQKEAYILPWTNPLWLSAKSGPSSMLIPAGAADTVHSFELDPTPYLKTLPDSPLQNERALTVYNAALHLHTRGTHASTEIVHADGTKECLLDIPRWDFHWQGSYGFKQAKTLAPGDALRVECHWDNTTRNQPMVNGVQTAPRDVTWGETTEDEMCLGLYYVTQ